MRKLSLTLPFLLLSGCFIAPGMNMDEGAAVARGRETTRDDNFKVQPITAELIRKLSLEPPPALTRDPFAAEAATYEYRVAPFDVLMVTVWDHPELTTPTGQYRSPEENGNRVNGDGTIFYPYVGVVQVAGKTVAEVRRILLERLRSVIANPQLDVRVAAFRGRRMQVTGEVTQPTTVAIIDVPLRVQDAIALAHGFTPEADWSNVTLSRDGRAYRLDLLALYEYGDLSQNWLLRDGDVLNVGDRSKKKVFIVGEVQNQTARVMVKDKMTLAEALLGTGGGRPADLSSQYLANGLFQQVSDPARIYVIRGDFSAPAIYKLDAGSPDAMLLATSFQMKPRDVVFVSTYDVARWARIMNQLVPTVNSLWQTYDVVQRSR